jgi:hypothetical protein
MIYNSIVKSVLIYGAETWSLYKEDRRRIKATEMDALRRSATIYKKEKKTNEYIRGKMDAQDMILDDITRIQLICYGHVERMVLYLYNTKFSVSFPSPSVVRIVRSY